MKNKKNLLIIGCIIVVLGIISSFSSPSEEFNNSVTNNQLVVNTTETITEPQEEKYYEDDETINRYIVLFNNINPNNKITSDMLSVYYHHGSEHKDQVKLVLDGLDVIISANYKDSISINIDNPNKDNDAIKALILQVVKVFNPYTTAEHINQYVDSQGVTSDINTYENVEYWTSKGVDGKRIAYIKITGKLE